MYKKILFLTLILIFLSSTAYSKTTQQKLTVEHLIESNWGPEYSLGVNVNFQLQDGKDKYYEADAHYGHYGDQKSGFYYIKNNKLDLHVGDSDEIFLKGGKLMFDDNAVKYSLYIIFDDGTIIYDKYSEVKDGTEVKIDGYDAVTIISTDAGLEYNMKFRTAPSLNGEIIHIWYGDGPDEEQLAYVPKEVKIKVIARTKNKQKVKNWNNYWYYVEVPDSYGWSYQKGWMFGEFIILN